MFRLRLALVACVCLSASANVGAQQARVEVKIIDEAGEVTPARAWVTVDGQRYFAPESPFTATPYRQDQSFSCDGRFVMAIPPGEAIVHVEKGKEFRPVNVAVSVKPGETTQKTVRLQRWIDMPALGWYSADMHVHLGFDNPSVLRQLALADDVHLLPAFTYWLRGQGETWNESWPDASFTEPIRIDARHVVTRNNLEIERIARDAAPGAEVGATFLFHLSKPVTADRYGEHFPTDAELCGQAREHSPRSVFDSDKPSWAETVVGAALGSLDTIQVCHNHYHRTSTLAGGYGMIGPLAAGESNEAAGDGLFHRTNALYYRLLNCGFRLGVSGGSAIGVMPVPAGFHRVYASLDGPMSVDAMWDAIRSGRSFATTGPMLFLTANGQPPGSILPFRAIDAMEVSIELEVKSIEAIEALELIQNGRLVASIDLREQASDPVLKSTLVHHVKVERSGWIAGRALYRAPDGLLRQAHTSPVYLEVDRKPTAFAEDARYMLRWIAHLRMIADHTADHFPDQAAREQVMGIYASAEARYEQIVQDAQTHWER